MGLKRIVVMVAGLALLALVGQGFPALSDADTQEPPLLPNAADWTDYGLIIDAAPFGAGWDALFEGRTPAALVKKDGTYFLYYVGADDYISDKNNIGPAHRSIGVATSMDGINWTKYAGNPVLTFSSSGNPEEGAVSAGVYVDANGVFHAFYGTNVAATQTTSEVNANVRFATSSDGLHFVDQGIILNHADSTVWGAGDELHATMAWKQADTWYAFYVPNGVAAAGNLAVAWGSDPSLLRSSSAVKSAGIPIRGGPGSVVQLDASTLAYFITRGGTTEVRTAPVTDPSSVSAPVRSYQLTGNGKVVYLDMDRRTWFMVYDKWSHMGLQLAPYGSRDTTPPTAPFGLSVAHPNHQTAVLSWKAATDPDTGIVQYDVFREGQKIGSTTTLSFTDLHLSELSAYTYEVRAVNYHGTQGLGTSLTTVTPPDTQPARIVSVQAASNPYELQVKFDEPVAQASAEDPANYQMDNGLAVSEATLGADGMTVTLSTTAAHQDNAAYTLSVVAIADRAQSPNYATGRQRYTYSAIPGLVAYYALEKTAEDASGANQHGILNGSPAWPAGKIGQALGLTGSEYIEIDHAPGLDRAFSGSHTLTGWVLAAAVPSNTTTSNGAFAVFSGPNGRLEYTTSQQFMVHLSTSAGSTSLTSPVVGYGQWHHLAVVVDSVGSRVALYVDGLEVTGSPAVYSGQLQKLPRQAIGVMDEYYARYRIGVHDPLFDYEKNYFIGQLDEVRIYDWALSKVEIGAVADLTTPSPSATPAHTAATPPTDTPTPTPTLTPAARSETPPPSATTTPKSGSTWTPVTSTQIPKSTWAVTQTATPAPTYNKVPASPTSMGTPKATPTPVASVTPQSGTAAVVWHWPGGGRAR